MPTPSHERALLVLLQPIIQGHQSGQAVSMGESGGVVIERRGHVRGIWRCMTETFAWTPAGYNEPTYHAADLDHAVRYTQTVVLAA